MPRSTRRTKVTPCHPQTTTLSPSQLAQDLGVRDLTDPDQGRHAIQLLVDAAVAGLATAWNCPGALATQAARGPGGLALSMGLDRLLMPRKASPTSGCSARPIPASPA
jgi:hypothetical protein